MDSSLTQVFKGVCLAVFLSSVHGSTACNGENIQLRVSEGWYCDGEERRVEILCDGQLGTITNVGRDDISSTICRRIGCDGGTKASATINSNETYGPVWRVNCDDGDYLSLTGCRFTRAKPNEGLPIISVKCNDLNYTNTLITIDMVEFAFFIVTIILGAILLYHFVGSKFKLSFKENDQPKSQPMPSSSHLMVQVATDDANQPETVDEEDAEPGETSELVDSSRQEVTTEKVGYTSKQGTVEEEGTEIGETPELVYNVCYGAVTVEDENDSSKHETMAPEDMELGEVPEFVDNVCYDSVTDKTGHSSNDDWGTEEDTERGENPELVYNVCYGAVASNEGQSSTHGTSNDQKDTDQGQIPEFVDNICYEGVTEEEGRPQQIATNEEEYEALGQTS